MQNKKIRILNFDDSVIQQKKLLARYDAEIIDLKDVCPRARFWYGRKEKAEIQNRISSSDKNAVTFLGSGDFHHISEILISAFDEPISVIDFDFHPDWSIISPIQNCGSWVNGVLKRKNILKYVLLGVSSSDISSFALYTANFGAMKDNRAEIYPYSHKPSIVYFRNVPDNISINIERHPFMTRIRWDELRTRHLQDFLKQVIERLPSKKVYITIDKDCLNKKHALTNWEEGRFKLEDLVSMLKVLRHGADIAGVDITGEYSDTRIEGVWKNIISHLDHPKDFSAKGVSESEILRVNEETNLTIMQILG